MVGMLRTIQVALQGGHQIPFKYKMSLWWPWGLPKVNIACNTESGEGGIDAYLFPYQQLFYSLLNGKIHSETRKTK